MNQGDTSYDEQFQGEAFSIARTDLMPSPDFTDSSSERG